MSDAAPPRAERRRIGGDFQLTVYPAGEVFPLRIDCGFVPTGWVGRREQTVRSAAFPGTAVMLEGTWYEVLRVEASQGSPRRYYFHLAPWEDQHTFRKAVELTAEEARRLTAAQREVERNQKRAGALRWLSPLLGLLPAANQRRLEAAYGMPAAHGSAVSAGVLLAVSVLVLVLAMASTLGMTFGEYQQLVNSIVAWKLLFMFWLIESLARLYFAMSGQPSGSLPVALPVLAVEGLFDLLRSNKDAGELAGRRGFAASPDALAQARDTVRRPRQGEHDLEVISRLPKEHWTAGVTGIGYEGESYFLDEREVIETTDGVRHRFLLKKAAPDVLFRSFSEYHPEEVREVYRRKRRQDAAMWVETFAFFWGLVGPDLQARLAKAYNYDPWKFTRRTIAGTAVIAAGTAGQALWLIREGLAVSRDAVVLLAALYLLWEAALRWRDYRAGRIRASLLGLPFQPLARRAARWA